MSQDRPLSDHEIEQLLRGDAVDPSLDGIAEWAAAVRQNADATVDASTASEQVAAAAAAAGSLVPAGQALGALPRRPLTMRKLYNSFAARVAAIASALLLATTGVAAAGVLPPAIQEPVADVYGVVGLDFHDHEEGDDDDGHENDGGEGQNDVDEPVGVTGDDDDTGDDESDESNSDDDEADHDDDDESDDDDSDHDDEADDDEADHDDEAESDDADDDDESDDDDDSDDDDSDDDDDD